jgi:hypothetical protein
MSLRGRGYATSRVPIVGYLVGAFNIGFDVKGLREWGANHHICIYFQF